MLPAASPSRDLRLPLPFERYFEVSLYLMVLAGFGTLASTRALDFPTLLLVSGALLFRGYLLFKRDTLRLSESWTNSLTVAYLAFYLADYFLISGAFLTATVHLVLFVMLVRLYSAKRDRDYYFLAVLAFLTVLAASVLTVDSVFLVAFAGFMLMAVATFILMEMRHTSSKAAIRPSDANDEQAARRMAVSLAGAAPLIVLLILMGAVVIFFVLPRVSAGYLSAYAVRNELTTGFSDKVELGQIGRIQQSGSVVMHVQMDGDSNGGFELLRGIAFSVFDGRAWSNPGYQHLVPRMPDGRFALSPAENRLPAASQFAAGERSVHYRVMMEPVGSNIFFLALRPQTLRGNYRLISMDSGGAVFEVDGEHPVGSYEASSTVARPSPAELRAASGPYPPEVLRHYLQLPRLDPRIPRLAAQITASAADNYDKAAAVETYLLTHFGYTLQLSRTPPSDPLAEFLFIRKQGHCEYFASSMAVMLRSLGIPARVVNGFRMNEFNDVTSQYVVRDSDAHSWVEAYFPGYGWVSFDPTPGGPAQAHTAWSRMLLYVDAMESFWREWVINYDIGHQVALGQSTVQSSQRWFLRLRNQAMRRYLELLAVVRRAHLSWAGFAARWIAGGGLAAALLLLLANARRLWRAVRRNRLADRPEKSPRLAAEIWYERMIHILGRRGWRKPLAQTPVEFVRGIDDPAVRERVARFTLHYEWARFGGSADHARRLPELYRNIVASARR
jgi:protein-glutamine gamma-glutamyltransferase